MLREVSFGWESLAALLDAGLEEHVRRHWEEVGVHKEKMPLAVDWERYRKLEDLEILKLVGARYSEKLVGYSSFMVLKHLHYSTTWHAINDAIWIEPAERGLGIRMIRETEKLLRASVSPEIVRIQYHVKTDLARDRGTYGRVFEALGYKHFENVYDKLTE